MILIDSFFQNFPVSPVMVLRYGVIGEYKFVVMGIISGSNER